MSPDITHDLDDLNIPESTAHLAVMGLGRFHLFPFGVAYRAQEVQMRWNALREVKARLNQASFRDAVLAAYGGAARSSIGPNRGCSIPPTSSWMATSS